MVRGLLHLAQRLVRLLRVGHEQHRPRELGRGGLPGGLLRLGEHPRDVPEVQHPDDVVGVLRPHRHPGQRTVQQQSHGLLGLRRRLDRHHVGAGHHHLAHRRVAPLEDRVDQLAVDLLEHVELGRLVDHREQLLLRCERGGGAGAAGGHAVAEPDQHTGERTEDQSRCMDHRCRREQQPARMGPADAAGARADQHEGDAGHDHGRDEQHEPRVVDERRDREGDEHGRARLRKHPEEVDGVDVGAGVHGDREEGGPEPGSDRGLLHLRT